MGDEINKLPTDDSVPSKTDIDMVGALFQNNNKEVKKVAYELKDTVIAGVLFLILSLSVVDKFIKSCGCENEIYSLIIKVLLFMVVFYVLKNRV